MTRSEVQVPHRPPLRGVFCYYEGMYFIRHGESVNNALGIYTGQLDVPLSEKGREQALQSGDSIAVNHVHIQRIISSPARRAYDTALIIAKRIGLERGAISIDARLLERKFGSLEGTSKVATKELTDDLLLRVGGETNTQVRSRIQEFMEEIQKEQHLDELLIVGHNGSGKQIIGLLKGLGPDQSFYESPTIPNGVLIDLKDLYE